MDCCKSRNILGLVCQAGHAMYKTYAEYSMLPKYWIE